MGWISSFEKFHDKIDPLDAWVQERIIGDQKEQEQFIATYGPYIAAAAATIFSGGAAAPAAAGATGTGAAAGGAAAAGTAAAGAGAAGAAGTYAGMTAAEIAAAEAAASQAAAAGGYGLLGAEGATLGTGSAQLGTQGLLGMGSTASGTAAPEAAGLLMGQGGMSAAGANVVSNGATGSSFMSGVDKYGKPIAQAAQQANQQANAQQPQAAPPPQLPKTKVDLNGLLSYGQQQQQYEQQENERRRQLMNAYASNIGRF